MKIRNKATYHQLKAQGICVQCARRYATPGETMCEWCKEHKAELNQLEIARAQQDGFCGRHRKVKALPGMKQCVLCICKDRYRKRQARVAA